MPKQYTQQQQHLQSNTNKHQQQQQQQQHNYLTQQSTALSRKSPKPSYSLTLNNKYNFATATTPATTTQTTTSYPTTATTRNCLSNKDLTIYEFSHLKDCDLDHNDDYYLPSSMEILGIQKSLQHVDNEDDEDTEDDVANLVIRNKNKANVVNDNVAENESEDEERNVAENKNCVAKNNIEDLDNKSVKRLSANLNDLEISKNATNNLLKQQHHQQQQQETNRLWYH
ncbi:uncharacterized protein ACRADG_005142 [Cochliomyia hominivorax]